MTDAPGPAGPDDDLAELEALAAAGDRDEDADVAYMQELIAAERDGARTTLVIGPFTAMTIIGLLQLATRHPYMPAGQVRIARDVIDQFQPIAAERDGARATLVMGPFTAMTVIGLLQLATRRRDMPAGQVCIARDVIDQFQPLFTGTPGADIIRRGGHPEFDK